ncbi:MAG: hypothetical protein ACYS6Z_05245 [Planctomycetota bacterium]|jgi:hypothetical protein
MASRRLLKRLAIVAAVLVAAHIAWTHIEKRAFKQRIIDLRVAKQPLYTTDLATVPVPDEKNAAKLLEEAAAWLEEHRDADGDGHLWYGLDSGTEDWDEHERKQATAYLEKLAPYYAMLDEIPKRPRWWLDLAWEEGPGAAVSVIPQLQEAVEYTRYRVAYDLVEAGGTERAARASILLLDLVDRCELPFLIGHLVREFIRDSDEILRLAERQPGFDARLFREMVDPRLARTLRQLGPPAAPLKEERTIALWVVRAWLAGDGSSDDRIERNALWRPMLYRDASRMLDMYAQAIAACGVRPEDAHAIGKRLWEEGEEVPVVYSLTRMHGMLPGKLFKEYAASTAKRRLTRVVMALLEYRQTRGEWPQDLAALGRMPLDPYAGAPFLYERRGKGARIRPARPETWELLLEDDLAWSWEE